MTQPLAIDVNELVLEGIPRARARDFRRQFVAELERCLAAGGVRPGRQRGQVRLDELRIHLDREPGRKASAARAARSLVEQLAAAGLLEEGDQ